MENWTCWFAHQNLEVEEVDDFIIMTTNIQSFVFTFVF